MSGSYSLLQGQKVSYVGGRGQVFLAKSDDLLSKAQTQIHSEYQANEVKYRDLCVSRGYVQYYLQRHYKLSKNDFLKPIFAQPKPQKLYGVCDAQKRPIGGMAWRSNDLGWIDGVDYRHAMEDVGQVFDVFKTETLDPEDMAVILHESFGLIEAHIDTHPKADGQGSTGVASAAIRRGNAAHIVTGNVGDSSSYVVYQYAGEWIAQPLNAHHSVADPDEQKRMAPIIKENGNIAEFNGDRIRLKSEGHAGLQAARDFGNLRYRPAGVEMRPDYTKFTVQQFTQAYLVTFSDGLDYLRFPGRLAHFFHHLLQNCDPNSPDPRMIADRLERWCDQYFHDKTYRDDRIIAVAPLHTLDQDVMRVTCAFDGHGGNVQAPSIASTLLGKHFGDTMTDVTHAYVIGKQRLQNEEPTEAQPAGIIIRDTKESTTAGDTQLISVTSSSNGTSPKPPGPATVLFEKVWYEKMSESNGEPGPNSES